ncbi:MAG: hypothetical protein WCW62_06945 [Bacteroidales bacterium]|jgi:hypothetical protein
MKKSIFSLLFKSSKATQPSKLNPDNWPYRDFISGFMSDQEMNSTTLSSNLAKINSIFLAKALDFICHDILLDPEKYKDLIKDMGRANDESLSPECELAAAERFNIHYRDFHTEYQMARYLRHFDTREVPICSTGVCFEEHFSADQFSFLLNK